MSEHELKTKAIEANSLPFDKEFFKVDHLQANSKENLKGVNALWENIMKTQVRAQ